MRCQRNRQACRISSMMSAMVDLRAEIVAGDRDADAARVEPARHVAEHRGFERAPVAAVNEEGERRLLGRRGPEQIDGLPRCVRVGEAEFGAALLHRQEAIGFRVPRPARENLRVLGHARAVVVFHLVVDRRHRLLPVSGKLGPSRCRGQVRFAAGANRVMKTRMKVDGRHTRSIWLEPDGCDGRRDRPDRAAASLRHGAAHDAR